MFYLYIFVKKTIMKFGIFLAVLLLKVAVVWAGDTLRSDTVLFSSGPPVKFKAGTIVEYNQFHKVISGTPAQTVSLWTTGPLVSFSSSGSVKFNKSGRVISGIPANDFSAECVNGEYITVEKNFRTIFDKNGKVEYCRSADGFEVDLKAGRFIVKPGGLTVFYSSGILNCGETDEKLLLKTASGIYIFVSPYGRVYFDEKGFLQKAVLAKRTIFFLKDNTKVERQHGSTVSFDADGFLINDF